MSGLAEAIVLGRLGQDPEIRYTQSGVQITTINVATSSKIGDEDVTDWHRVTFFGKRAEVVGEYFQKGSQILVRGRIQNNNWEDSNGVKHYGYQIVGDAFSFVDKREGTAPNKTQPDDDIPF